MHNTSECKSINGNGYPSRKPNGFKSNPNNKTNWQRKGPNNHNTNNNAKPGDLHTMLKKNQEMLKKAKAELMVITEAMSKNDNSVIPC